MDLSKNVETSVKRLDVVVLVGGILFSFAVLALTWWAGPRLDAVELLPDQVAAGNRSRRVNGPINSIRTAPEGGAELKLPGI